MREPDGLPASPEAERSILGAILLENGITADAAAVLQPEHFFLDAHRRIYGRMMDLYDHGKPIDPISLADELVRHRELEAVGGKTYLANLTDGVPRRRSIDNFLDLVREKYNLRTLLFTMNALSGRIADGEKAKDCIEALEEALLKVSTVGKSARHISDLMHGAVDEIHRLREIKDDTLGLSLDFSPLNDSTTGIRRDELWVVGARPNVGKTPFALQIALANAKRGKKVHIFEMEMSDLQTANRFLIHHGVAHPWKLRDPRRMDQGQVMTTAEGAAELAKLPIWIDDTGTMTVREMRTKILAGIRKFNTDLIIVDYLQLIRGEGKRYEVTSDAAAGLREIVRKTKVPILALSQLNRNAKDPKKAPDLADLRESGVIEQEANVVVLIHRPLVEDGDREDALSNKGKFILAKVREGVRGPEPFYFNDETLTFEPEYMAELRNR